MKRGNNCVIQTKDGYGYAPPPLPAFPTWRHHPPDPPPTPEGAAVPDNVGGPPSLSLPRTANMAALTKSTTMVYHIVLSTAMCVPLFI